MKRVMVRYTVEPDEAPVVVVTELREIGSFRF